MFLKKILGLTALGALLIVAAPAQQSQANPFGPGIAIGQSDAGKLTTNVHHINGQPHRHHHHHHHWQTHHHH